MSKFDLDKYGISPADIKDEVTHLQSEAEANSENIGLFTLKTANEWMEQAKGRPIPKMLFGEFWYEGEICILFADTNLGKSILAVQIGDSISLGHPVGGFRFEAEKQKVIYLDFELSEKQFENRYSVNYENHYVFDDNFFRVEINSDADIPTGQSFEDFLHDSLERLILETDAKVIIVDNITYLSSETEKAKDALPLMKKLKALKNKYGLSMLILAHTPKRDTSKPITHNDLQGSKMLINFCDSSFAIGECHTDKQLKYVKQIKARNTEILYHADNVCVFQITKPLDFLMLDFLAFGKEREYLKQPTESDKETRNQKIAEMHSDGKSQRDIGKELGISAMTVSRALKEIKEV